MYRDNLAPIAPDNILCPEEDVLGFTLETYERFIAGELNFNQMYETLEFARKIRELKNKS